MMQRRDFLRSSMAASGLVALAQTSTDASAIDIQPQDKSTAPAAEHRSLRIAPFRFDVTPPLGHSLCGGWIQPATEIDDPLEAIGFVVLGNGAPIVFCSVDWTGILNKAHLRWREALAEAAGTAPDRVAVHCVHPHDAPFACIQAQEIVASLGGLPNIVDLAYFDSCLEKAKGAVRQALDQSVPLTCIGHGQAIVEQVASNRNIIDLSGKVIGMRGSSSKDPLHHRLPEGLIDPYLKTVGFYNGDRMVVACHYYACHPMSHYGKGRVSSDFCGLARKQLQKDDSGCTHIYFNGCAGNIGAGKYNDGTPEIRPVLTERIFGAMTRSLKELKPKEIESFQWRTEDILPPSRADLDFDAILDQISDPKKSVVERNRPSYILAWLKRQQSGLPITLTSMHINDATILGLPAECFVEYQLRAQVSAPERFVATAAYADGGPWYIPTQESFPQGGYSVGMSWCSPDVDTILSHGILKLLKAS